MIVIMDNICIQISSYIINTMSQDTIIRINLIPTLLFLLISKTTTTEPTPLTLNTALKVTQKAQQHMQYTLTLPTPPQKGQNLFLQASSPFNDPFEEPTLTVSYGNRTVTCDEEAALYTGVCRVDGVDLEGVESVGLDVVCFVECRLEIGAYMDQVFRMEVSDTQQFTSFQQIGKAQTISITIPPNLTYTSILILTKLQNPQTATQGLSLYANYGPSPPIPTQLNYQMKAQATYGHRLLLKITDTEVKPGEKILLYLVVGVNNTVTVQTQVVSSKVVGLEVGVPVVSFLGDLEVKEYVVDFGKYDVPIDDKDILIKFITYTGMPKFRISFQPTFNTSIFFDSWAIESSFAYLITPSIRQQNNFTGTIYINVSTYFTTSYYLIVQVNRKQFLALENQVMQMVKLQRDKIQNFIYEDENLVAELKGDVVRYRASVQMISGAAEIGIRDCDSVMTGGDVVECLIKDVEELRSEKVRKSFENVQGQMKRYLNLYQIYFSYNVTKCPKASTGTHKQRHICDFHILVHNLQRRSNTTNQLYLGIQVTKYTEPKQLKQGQITKDSVPEQSINYYQFQLESVQNITRLEFYTTVIMGDISMLVSRNNSRPDYENMFDNGSDVEVSITGSYVVQGERLGVGVYYVGVYGYEISDYTISVAIQRKNGQNQSEVTEIQLKKGMSQQYNMPKNKTTLQFTFPTHQPKKIQLKIQQVQGQISYSVYSPDPYTQKCNSYQSSQSGTQSCIFTTQQNTTYKIKITGNASETKIFYISYRDVESDACAVFVMDQPLYLMFRGKGADGDGSGSGGNGTDGNGNGERNSYCYAYTMVPGEDIQVTVAMGQVDRLQYRDKLQIKLVFQSGQQIKIDTLQRIITKQQLTLLCQPNPTTNTSSTPLPQKSTLCTFTLHTTLNTTTLPPTFHSLELMLAIQGLEDQNILFDGIPMKVITNNISTEHAKKFNYFVYDPERANDVGIYLVSETVSRYRVVAKVVGDLQYAGNGEGVYGGFGEVGGKVFGVNSSEFSPITLLTIRKQAFNTLIGNSNANVILISVYAIPQPTTTTTHKPTYIFTIELTQKQTSLPYGQSKIGYVNKDQIYSYQITIQPDITSLVDVRPLGVEPCYSSYFESVLYVKEQGRDGVFQSVVVEFNGIKVFSGEKGMHRILIQGKSDKTCTYQISYQSVQTPLKTILKSIPYQIKLIVENSTAFYLYHNPQNDSFTVIGMLNAGNSILYVQPINETAGDRVEAVMRRNLELYRFVGEVNGNVVVGREMEGFCGGCYYLVAVRGKPVVRGELVINPWGNPITIKQNAIIKSKLAISTNQTYQFYSITNFNITITIIYGRLNVTVQNFNNQTINTNNNISLTSNIAVQVPADASNNSADYFDERLKFRITVSAVKDSSYSIEIKKKVVGLRLYEGIPLLLELGSESQIVEFVSLEDAKTMCVLIEDMNYSDNPGNQLTIRSTFVDLGKTQPPTNTNLNLSQTKSQGTYNLQYTTKRGTYYLSLSSQVPTNISLTLAKQLLTHLVATRSLLATFHSIYQIWSPGDSIMIQIYSCLADIEVVASSDYGKLLKEEQEGVVRMEHANYGGHYVISSENLKGEYYVKTSNLDPTDTQPPVYVISYYLYTSTHTEKMPYKIYTLRSTTIDYSYTLHTIQFKLSKLHRMDSLQSKGTAIYSLYISNSTDRIKEMTKCSFGDVYTLTQRMEGVVVGGYDGGGVVFEVGMDAIGRVVGGVGHYYVGAQVTFSWASAKPYHAKSVNFVYDISQLIINNSPSFTNPSRTENTLFVLLWIIVPFIIGSFVLYLAARYFLRSLRYRPTELMEEEDPNNSEQIIEQTVSKKESGDSNADGRGEGRGDREDREGQNV